MTVTHEVFNQPAPLVDVNLFETNRPLQAALAFNAPGLDTAGLRALGATVGSAEMQTHAAVRLELWREHIGQARVGLHFRTAHGGAQRAQPGRVQPRRVEGQRGLQGAVGLEEVHVHQRRWLVEDLMRHDHGNLLFRATAEPALPGRWWRPPGG
jgi:hypothetical protein